MSCTICGRPTLPGGKLCAQCKAALKRARQTTVSQVEPLLHRAQGAAKRHSVKTDRHRRSKLVGLTSLPPEGAPRRLRLSVTLIALGAVVLAGYFGDQLLSAGGLQHFVAMSGTPEGSTVAEATEPVAEPMVAPPPIALREATPIADKALPPTGPSGIAPPSSPASRSAARSSPSREASKQPAGAAQVAAVPLSRFAGTASEAVAVAAAPIPPPVPTPQAAPPPDRWQSMSDAIARCGREGFLAGVICEQRARLQFCEGHWGLVAQCPGGIRNEYPR